MNVMGVLIVRFAFMVGIVLAGLTSAQAQPNTSTQNDVTRDHPEWFSEPAPYKPCPAAVVFPGQHSATCLGKPEYPTTITVYWRPRLGLHARGYFY
jgi:hypothetical protein